MSRWAGLTLGVTGRCALTLICRSVARAAGAHRPVGRQHSQDGATAQRVATRAVPPPEIEQSRSCRCPTVPAWPQRPTTPTKDTLGSAATPTMDTPRPPATSTTHSNDASPLPGSATTAYSIASPMSPAEPATMTIRCVVLPRGINVGGHNRVPMAELRPKLAEAGYTDPVTILQSGNIIVTAELTSEPTAEPTADQPDDAAAATAAAVAAAVQQLLADEFDVHVPCVARTAAEITAILERNPLGHIADNGSRYLINFLATEPGAEPDPNAVQSLIEADHAPEVVHVERSEVYVWAPEGVKALRLSYSHLERHFGVPATARNWNTLERIAAKL